MAVGLQLGIDQALVDADLKAASIGGHQRHRLDFRLERFDQLGR